MVDFVKKIREQGFDLQYLNIGGGLGIDYYHKCATIFRPLLLKNACCGSGLYFLDNSVMQRGINTAIIAIQPVSVLRHFCYYSTEVQPCAMQQLWSCTQPDGTNRLSIALQGRGAADSERSD